MDPKTPPQYDRLKKHWFWIVPILAAMLIQCLYFAWDNGQTVDETFYNGSGYPMVRYNNYQILGEHPPLLIQLGSLPLLFIQPKYPIDHPIYLGDGTGFDISKTGSKFLYEMGNDAHLILFLERIPIILLAMVSGVFIFLWAYELCGLTGALISSILYAFEPNMIAHSSLFTTDFGIAAFFLITFYFLKRFFKTLSVSDLIWTSVFAGLALLSKISAIVLIPITLLLFGVFSLLESRSSQKISIRHQTFNFILLFLSAFIFYMAIGQKMILTWLGPLCLIILRLFLVEEKSRIGKWAFIFLELLFWLGWLICFVFLTMLFQKRGLAVTAFTALWIAFSLASTFLIKNVKSIKYTYLIKCFILIWLLAAVIIILDYTDFYVTLFRTKPFNHYIQAFNISTSHALSNHKICRGSFVTCDWRYFIAVMSIKTPVVTLILFFLGLFGILKSRQTLMNKLLILVPPTIFLFVASFLSTINIGLRHILPVYPFIFLIAGGTSELIVNIKQQIQKRIVYVVLTATMIYFMISSGLVTPHNLSYFNEFVRTPENGAKLVADSNLNWGQDNKRLAELMHRLGNPQVKIANVVNNAPEYNYYRLNWTYLPEEEFRHPKPGFYAMDLMTYFNQNDVSNSWFKGRPPTYKAGKVFYLFEVK